MKRKKRQLEEARRLDRSGDVEEAIRAWEKVGDTFEALGALGALYGQSGRAAEAVVVLEKAWAQRPRALGTLNNLGHAYRECGRFDDALQAFSRIVEAAPELPIGHYGVGTVARARGRLPEAHAAFSRAVKLSSGMAVAQLALAEVEELLGRPGHAIQTLMGVLVEHGQAIPGLARRIGVLQALHGNRDVARAMLRTATEEDPDDAISTHMLAALEGRRVAPEPGYVAGLFDAYADGYDAHLVGVLETRVPERVAAAVGSAGRVLDLGCGTGLAVAALSGVTGAVGVDLSPEMVKRARRTGLYERVEVGPILGFLQDLEERFDVAVAADVLAYFGDLSALMASLRGRVDRFVFTTEHAERDWELRPTGRYAHSPEHVRSAAAGWTEVSAESGPLRREGEGWVTGTVWVLEGPRA